MKLLSNENREFFLPVLLTQYHLRIVISSLALGGAEKIVLDWAKSEANRGKMVELAVLNNLENEWPIPKGIKIIRRHQDTSTKEFVSFLANRWRINKGAISTHLIRDNILKYFWDLGIKTIPVFHNGRQGWRNNPSLFQSDNVPLIIGCAESVSEEIKQDTDIPVVTIRHQASVSNRSLCLKTRAIIRKRLGIPDDVTLVGAIGALKPQKNYTRAIRIIAEMSKLKPTYFCILGGALNQEGEEQLNSIKRLASEYNISEFLCLPGFVNPVDDYLAAFDVVLNTSHHEGFSIATQEALVAGLEVIATKVNGQTEISHNNLTLIEPSEDDSVFIKQLLKATPRSALVPSPVLRADRLWSIPNAWSSAKGQTLNTLFVTANLNAGGAQRSLVNLCKTAVAKHRDFAIAVCNGCTHDYFSKELKGNGVNAFHFTKENDVFDIARGLFTLITRHSVNNVCFWNVDPKIKLLLSKFLNKEIKLVDVSPGAYAFEEMKNTVSFQRSIGFNQDQYFARLNHLVFKHDNGNENINYDINNTLVIRNGVESLSSNIQSSNKRFLVCGRIAESKHLITIIKAFKQYFSIDPSSELIIYGQAEAKNSKYLDFVQSEAFGSSIVFKGESFDFRHFQDSYTCTIILGTNQGCPNAVLEAMSAGVPVIANDSGGTQELLSCGSGFLLPETIDQDALLNAMITVSKLSVAELDNKAGIGKQFVSDNFSLEKMYLGYSELLFSDQENGLARAI